MLTEQGPVDIEARQLLQDLDVLEVRLHGTTIVRVEADPVIGPARLIPKISLAIKRGGIRPEPLLQVERDETSKIDVGGLERLEQLLLFRIDGRNAPFEILGAWEREGFVHDDQGRCWCRLDGLERREDAEAKLESQGFGVRGVLD